MDKRNIQGKWNTLTAFRQVNKNKTKQYTWMPAITSALEIG